MKKTYLGVLIGIFLFSGSLFGVKAWGFSSIAVTGAKNGGVGIYGRVRRAGANIGSLPTALRSVISQTLGANDPHYRLSPSDGGYRAVNGGNGLSATIGLHGFTVRSGANEWGLRLAAWGRGRGLEKVGAGRVVSNSNRLAINRGGITEWWVNGPVGIEQGWTVANRQYPGRDAGGHLTLLLRQSGDLRAQVLSPGRSLTVLSNTGRQVLRYTGLRAYDKNGKPLPAHFEATNRYVRVVVNDTNAVYPVRIDPWVQAAELTGSDGAQGNMLGTSVAVSSDGSTVVVGAPYANVAGSNYYAQGAVYVFKEPASGWANETEAARLTQSDGGQGYGLGTSVAVSSDGSTVVAGAPYATVGSSVEQGAVCVFEEPASGWANETETARLTAPNGAGFDVLGSAVAVSSDGSTVVAGASYATVGSNKGRGAVYVFRELSSGWASWTEAAELTASDGAADDSLGCSVAVSSGGSTVVAGASGVSKPAGSQNDQGALYVFKEPVSGWADGTETARLAASDSAANYDLGAAVAVSPDGATVVAGAEGATVGGNVAQGAVYVFQEPATGWVSGTETARLTASDGAGQDNLGVSVAVGSGGATVVAGASYAAVGSNFAQGAVYEFKEPATGWVNETETAKLTALDGAGDDEFGSSVALSPDGATVVVGAPSANRPNSSAPVYVFQGPFWQNSLDFGGGWQLLGWFGNFNTNPSPWIYHQKLGSLYPIATSTESIWFYDPQWDGAGGWWWTSSSFFPWVYSVTENEWLYFDAKDSSVGARWFFTTAGQPSTH